MRNLLMYPPPVIRNLLDKTKLYRAARYFHVSRQVTPDWKILPLAKKIDHARRVYQSVK